MRILAALALLAGAAHAQVVSRVDLNACGIYESTVQGREDDARSASGKRTIVQDERLVKETTRIARRVLRRRTATASCKRWIASRRSTR